MLIGVDSGQSAMKAVVVDPAGQVRGSASVSTIRETPHPRWVERDMTLAWEQCADVIGMACTDAGVAPAEVRALSLVGHGDGLYPVDDQGAPTRSAILALDSRAAPLLGRWHRDGVVARARAVTGQEPHAGSIAPLASWLRDNEPDVWARSSRLINCKDWLRWNLTGSWATDPVEAASCFGRLDGSGYEPRSFDIYGLPEVADRLGDIIDPVAVAGEITASAAARTGLTPGTPVVTGTHDIVGALLGAGASGNGMFFLMAGTYCITQVLATGRRVDPSYQARPWVGDDEWVYMGASPASATNLDWFLALVAAGESDPIALANAEAATVLDEPGSVLFHPFLFGSAYGPQASASFLGLRGWHTRAHLLRAVFEGIVFNHLVHVGKLASVIEPTGYRLTGGGARSELWCQMFADGLGAPVETVAEHETGAVGAEERGGHVEGDAAGDIRLSTLLLGIEGMGEEEGAATQGRPFLSGKRSPRSDITQIK